MTGFVVLVWIPALLAQGGQASDRRTVATDIAAGAKTFRSHCAPCHGLNGEGGRGPNLASGNFFHGSTDAELLRNISDGIEGTEMPGLFYSEDRVRQVVAYLRSLNQTAAAQVDGDIAAGERLFAAKGCVKCHRVSGRGGRVGPDLTTIGMSRAPEYLRRALFEPGANVAPRYWVVRATGKDGRQYAGFLMNEDTYTVQLLDMQERLQSLTKADLRAYKVEKTSQMPSYKNSLTERERADLVAYLCSLRPAGGAQ